MNKTAGGAMLTALAQHGITLGPDKTGEDFDRHRAGHPEETAPELSCGFCRDEIRKRGMN